MHLTSSCDKVYNNYAVTSRRYKKELYYTTWNVVLRQT